MIKNFHFKMLIGISISAFVIGFIYLSAGLRSGTDGVGGLIGGLYCMFGLFASITAGAIRSISSRLDRGGIANDPEHPTSNRHTINRNAEQAVPSDGQKPSGDVASTDPTAPADAH